MWWYMTIILATQVAEVGGFRSMASWVKLLGQLMWKNKFKNKKKGEGCGANGRVLKPKVQSPVLQKQQKNPQNNRKCNQKTNETERLKKATSIYRVTACTSYAAGHLLFSFYHNFSQVTITSQLKQLSLFGVRSLAFGFCSSLDCLTWVIFVQHGTLCLFSW
jgi:hypothetical protein